MKTLLIAISSVAFAFGALGCGKGEAPPAPTPETVAAAHDDQGHAHPAGGGDEHGHAGTMGGAGHEGMMGGAGHEGTMGYAGHEGTMGGAGHAGTMGGAGHAGTMGGTGQHGMMGGGADHDAVVSAYEAVRQALAKDDLAAAKTAAKALVAAAREPHPPVATAAATIDAAADIEAARLAFGETSKALITVLSAMPEMGKGLHVFHCPMAKGYQKWVQPSATLENPYMGQRMPTCGSASDLKP